MLPAVALVGRPNVGKSTLFNQLTRSRDALVADYPGVTRDRRYGFGRREDLGYIVIDTGGLGASGSAEIEAGVERQVGAALEEADLVVLVVDYREGLNAADERIAERLRRSSKPVTVAVNKAEGIASELAGAEFHGFGFGEPVRIAALHGQGIRRLLDRVLAPFEASETPDLEAFAHPRLAVVGRPNVGKSTLINRLIGAERLITSPVPGTTRDSIFVPCERDGRTFTLIDTAGIRRRAKVSEAVEKFSVVQSLQAIETAGVAVVLLDAHEGVTEQDQRLIGLVVARGRALVIGVNKWDGLTAGQRRRIAAQVDRQLGFVPFASVHYVSALHGSGIADVIGSAFAAYEAAGTDLATPKLNAILEHAIGKHPPPVVRGRQVRLRYAHQGGRYPPVIVVHGSQAARLPAHYRRYLENCFREALGLDGTPVRVELKSGGNPFAGRRNVLTPRQLKRRKRIIRHTRGGR